MGTFVIYTYGGGDILRELLNIVAILFKSDNPYTTSFLKLMLSIGVLWATTLAVLRANIGLFGKTWFLPTFAIVGLLLTPKCKVNIIDRVNQHTHYSAVADVPLGIGLLMSTPSIVGDSLAKLVDEQFSNNEAQHFTTTGPLFGARLIIKASQTVIPDPTLRDNIKSFMGRCYVWPFLYTNIKPGREEALSTPDILDFIEKNAHKSLGSYWREEGQSTFLSCADCTKKVKDVMAGIGKTRVIPSLINGLFGHDETRKPDNKTQLERYFTDAWKGIAQEAQTLHTVVNQSLLINAYYEHIDDRRESFGLNRIQPHMLGLTAGRASAHQNTSALTKGILAGEHIPQLQTIILALLAMTFVLVVPFSLLPGGFQYLTLWVQLCVWVSTWPVFFAILNGIAHLFLASSLKTHYLAGGSGLTLATQSGLTDTAYSAYCWTMGLMLSIPYLSWAFISKSSYALSQSVMGMTESVGAQGAKLTSDSVDGNLSFDNTSIGNRSLFGTQIAQQTLGSNINFGETVNDGALSLTYGPQGAVAGNAALSNLATSVQFSESDTESLSKQMTDSFQKTGQRALSYASHLAHADLASSGFTNSEAWERRKAGESTLSALKTFADEHGMSVDGSLRVGIAGTIAKVVPLGVNVEGHDSVRLNKSLNSTSGQNLVTALAKLDSFARQDSESASDTKTRDEAHSYAHQSTVSQNWAKVQSYTHETRAGIHTNGTDEAIDYAAKMMFRGDKSLALEWANTHRDDFVNLSRTVMAHRAGLFQEKIQQVDHVLSNTEVSDLWARGSALRTEDQFEGVKSDIARAKGQALQQETNQSIQDLSHKIEEQNQRLEGDHTLKGVYERAKRRLTDA